MQVNAWESVVTINHDIKAPNRGYQDWNTSQILTFGGYVKVRKSFYARVVIWVDVILVHIDIRAISSRYKDSCMVYKLAKFMNMTLIKTIHNIK